MTVLASILLVAVAATCAEAVMKDGTECRWRSPVEGKANSGNLKTTLNDISIEECKKRVEAEPKSYKSFKYHKLYKRCYLSDKDRSTFRLTVNDANYAYYELDCVGNFPDECEWEGPLKKRYLGQGRQITLSSMTVEACRTACETETTFHCVSFDYYHPSSNCYLQIYSRYNYAVKTHASYEYYERNCHDKFRYCNLADNATYATPLQGQYLSGTNPITLSKTNVAECKKACIQRMDFHCLAFDYDHVSENCRLKIMNREMGGILYDNTNYDYYELVSCPKAEPKKVDPKTCKWTNTIQGYISGNDKKTLSGITFTQCKTSCEKEDDFQCGSVDYYEAGKTCYLQEVTRKTHRVSVHSAYIFSERDCDEDFPENCEWVGPMVDRYISGNDLKTLTGLNIQECKKACENEETFRCMSFDYNFANGYCYLATIDRRRAYLSKSTSYGFYERICNEKTKPCHPKNAAKWKGPIHAKYISGYDLRTISDKTPEECKKTCLQSTEARCLGFDYRKTDNTCLLQGVTRADFELASSGSYDYYEIDECTGKLPEPAKVEESSCNWVGPKENYYIPGNDKKTLTNIDLADCKKACEDEMTFKCASFDYYKAVRYCYLQAIDRHGAAVSAHAAFDYYEYQCNDPFPKQCEWTGPTQQRYLSGYDYKTLSATSEEDCKKACESEDTFHCVSFDYIVSSRTCYLSLKTTYGFVLSTSASYSYFERNCYDKFRSCNKDSEAIWEGPLFGKYINAAKRTLASIDVAQCKLACLQVTDFHCLGFNFNSKTDTCYLLTHNRESMALTESASYEYYELISCPAKVTAAKKPSECKWLEAVSERYISGHDSQTVKDLDILGCKKACEEATAFDCRSFDVYSNICYLSTKDRLSVKLSTHSAYTYYERDCSPTFPEECEWAEPIHRHYISSNDLKTVYTSSPAECKAACEAETEFHCTSFDFYRPSERCYLQMANLYNTYKLTKHDDYDFFERRCNDKYRSCQPDASVVWEGPINGKGISGQVMATMSGIEVEGCKEACLQQTLFHCRSFDYNRASKTCYLATVTRDEMALTLSVAEDYYEIVSCTLPPPEPVETPKVKWREVVKGKYINGLDKLTLQNYFLDECKAECENTKAFKCRSFDYRPGSRICYLQEADRHSAVTTSSYSYEYHEIDYEENFPEECKWEEPQVRKYMGGSKKTLSKTSVEDCKTACEDEQSFFCVAFDYYVATETCYLLVDNMYTKKVANNVNYVFHERNCYDRFRSCQDGSAALWEGPTKGKIISGQDLKTLSYMSVDDCKAACLQEEDFHCRSFDYHRKSKICYLQALAHSEGTLLTDSTTNDYYELMKCDAVEERDVGLRATDDDDTVAKTDAGNGCTWMGPYNNYYVSGNDKKTLKNQIASTCMKACQEETTFECVSFDYNYGARTCYLQAVDRSTHKLSMSGTYQYYELDCNANYPAQCQWEGPVKARYISGLDMVTLTDMTVEGCKDACEEDCSIHCTSFDYIPSQKKCMLQVANRYTSPLATSTSYEYYERNCFNQYRLCDANSDADWTGPKYGKSLAGWKSYKTINKITEAECKTACQQATSFHCRAFIWNRSNSYCYLSSFSSTESDFADNLNYNLYELNGCPGDQPEIEDAEIGECVPEDFYVASCACSGDPHCNSYDNKWLHFMGTCFYTASRDNCVDGVPNGKPTWEVISNPNAGSVSSPVSYVRGAQVNLYEYDLEIGMYPGRRTTVNGVLVQGSPMRYADGKVKIVLAGSQAILTVKGGVQVVFSDTYLEIRVQTSMREKVCGLCGNFNGNNADDWMVGDSKYCMSKYPNAVPGTVTSDYNVMGTSWTNSIEEGDAKCIYECPNPPHPSGCENGEAYEAEDHCDTLQDKSGPFKACLAAMTEFQAKEVFDNCVYDACTLKNYEDIVCRHAASLAKVCTDMYNQKVSWRKTDFCPMKCGENMEYKPCDDQCLPTCADREGVNCGDLGPCQEGCFCKSGMVYDGKDSCIAESNCGCEVPALGIFINVGESYKAPDCSMSCTCESAGAALKCEDMACGDNYECKAKNGEPACVCDAPFVVEGGECIELPFPCEDEKEKLYCFTCDTTDEETCKEIGKMELCEGENTICKSTITTGPTAAILRVERKCATRNLCFPDSIGPNAKSCQPGDEGRTHCSTCSYGAAEPAEDAVPDYKCAVPVAPTEPPPESPCAMEMDTGTGGGKVSKYYYDAKTESCVKFKYEGKGGNANNFANKEECAAACGFQAPDNCSMPQDKGESNCDMKQTKRYSFDPKKKKCVQFKYTGCGGNENNFTSKKDCNKNCNKK